MKRFEVCGFKILHDEIDFSIVEKSIVEVPYDFIIEEPIVDASVEETGFIDRYDEVKSVVCYAILPLKASFSSLGIRKNNNILKFKNVRVVFSKEINYSSVKKFLEMVVPELSDQLIASFAERVSDFDLSTWEKFLGHFEISPLFLYKKEERTRSKYNLTLVKTTVDSKRLFLYASEEIRWEPRWITFSDEFTEKVGSYKIPRSRKLYLVPSRYESKKYEFGYFYDGEKTHRVSDIRPIIEKMSKVEIRCGKPDVLFDNLSSVCLVKVPDKITKPKKPRFEIPPCIVAHTMSPVPISNRVIDDEGEATWILQRVGEIAVERKQRYFYGGPRWVRVNVFLPSSSPRELSENELSVWKRSEGLNTPDFLSLLIPDFRSIVENIKKYQEEKWREIA